MLTHSLRGFLLVPFEQDGFFGPWQLALPPLAFFVVEMDTVHLAGPCGTIPVSPFGG